jgi:hypothetical protein
LVAATVTAATTTNRLDDYSSETLSTRYSSVQKVAMSTRNAPQDRWQQKRPLILATALTNPRRPLYSHVADVTTPRCRPNKVKVPTVTIAEASSERGVRSD